MSHILTKEGFKTEEDLLRELKVLRAELAVLKKDADSLKKLEKETELLKNLILSIYETSNLESALNIALRKICESTGWVYGEAWIPKNDGLFLECSPAHYSVDYKLAPFREAGKKINLKPGEGVVGRVFNSKTPLWINDISEENNFLRKELARQAGLKTGLVIPIVSREMVISIIVFYMTEIRDEDKSLISTVSTVSSQMGVIFEKKKLVEALIASEANYRELFDKANHAFFYNDTEIGVILDANDKACEMYGYTRDEFKGLKIEVVSAGIEPYTQDEAINLITKTVNEGPQLFEWLCKKKDGTLFWVEVHLKYALIRDKKRILVTVSDIADRKRKEEEIKILNNTLHGSLEQKVEERTRDLRESKERYRSLISNIPDVLWTTDDAGKTVFVSTVVKNVYGFTPEEIYNSENCNWFERIHPDDLDKVKSAYKKLFLTGKKFDVEYRLKRKDSRWIWINDRAMSTYVKDGKQYAEGILTDITDRKEIEKTKLELASIVESSDDAIISWDIKGYNLTWNKSAERIYGYTAEEIKGKNCSILVPNGKSHELSWVIDEIEQGRRIENLETIRIRKGGKHLNVLLTISPIRDENNKITGLSTIVRDITERKKAEGELVETQRKLSALVNHLPGVAFCCANDKQWTMEYLSNVCFELTGYKSEELINNKVVAYNSLIIPEDREYVWNSIQEMINKKSCYVIEYKIKAKDDQIKWVWEKGSGVFDSNGNVTAVEGFIVDVTEEKELRIELEEAKQKEQNEKELRTLEELITSPQKDVTTQLFGFPPLSQTLPEVFKDISKRYENLCLIATKEKDKEKLEEVSDELRFIGKQLGFLKVTPTDVIEIHSTVLKRLTKGLKQKQVESYTQTGRKMAIELMGYLVSYYRNCSINIKKSKLAEIESN